MIYAATRQEIEARRKAFIRKWRLKHRAVADSHEETRHRLFTFPRLRLSQWRSARTTNATERLHEEFKRRIKTRLCCRLQTPAFQRPSAPSATMSCGSIDRRGVAKTRAQRCWVHKTANVMNRQPKSLQAKAKRALQDI